MAKATSEACLRCDLQTQALVRVCVGINGAAPDGWYDSGMISAKRSPARAPRKGRPRGLPRPRSWGAGTGGPGSRSWTVTLIELI